MPAKIRKPHLENKKDRRVVIDETNVTLVMSEYWLSHVLRITRIKIFHNVETKNLKS